LSNKKLVFHTSAVRTGFFYELMHSNVLLKNVGPVQDALLLNPDKADEA